MNGIYKSYYDDGQLFYEVNYIDGKRNGIFKSYHENGQLWYKANYIDGKNHEQFYCSWFFSVRICPTNSLGKKV